MYCLCVSLGSLWRLYNYDLLKWAERCMFHIYREDTEYMGITEMSPHLCDQVFGTLTYCFLQSNQSQTQMLWPKWFYMRLNSYNVSFFSSSCYNIQMMEALLAAVSEIIQAKIEALSSLFLLSLFPSFLSSFLSSLLYFSFKHRCLEIA